MAARDSGDALSERRREAAEALRLDDRGLLAACLESFFVGSGPGGQHRNKAATAVRLVHLPTGVAVTATERRSQALNRGTALRRLRGALRALAHVPRPRRPTRPTRASEERRLRQKRHRARRKVERRGRGDD
ncbi:MAG TPA: peptide chain release factor-like protein [Myxococcaceae bacterium]|nr:peptide chain release factor-like protein [Myxococcaceae bacterium]